uniref:Uncharacterized protein n=1 Tax=Octopus bimaculoides TaxID=37653 RepID=A0A0L8FMC3_OCTBM
MALLFYPRLQNRERTTIYTLFPSSWILFTCLMITHPCTGLGTKKKKRRGIHGNLYK